MALRLTRRRLLGIGATLAASAPDLSILATARAAAAEAPLSAGAEDSLWHLGCHFYGGYPLVLCAEAVKWVYLPQSRAFARQLREAAQTGTPVTLEEPGWFWHDFPEPILP